MTREYTDIVIAGGGLTGYTLALLLAKAGITSSVVENSTISALSRKDTKDPRALSITPATQRILSNINVWQNLPVEKVGRFEKIHVWDEVDNDGLVFNCSEICSAVLGYIVEQSVLQNALGEMVDAVANINLITNNSISTFTENAGKVVCELSDSSIIESRLLVAADGAKSKLRSLAGLAIERIDYYQKAVACIVETQAPHEKIARQRFLKEGPIAFLPMRESNRCGVVWSVSSARAESLIAMDDQQFCIDLEVAFGSGLGKMLACESRTGFNLQRSRALNYFSGLCVLVGDAAHTVHPLAGQGANMGIADVAALSQLIMEAKSGGKDFASRQVLRRYERWRKTENNKMTLILEGIKNIFEDQSRLVSFARGSGMKLINRSFFVKNKMMKYAMGLSGDIPAIVSGSLIEEFCNAG